MHVIGEVNYNSAGYVARYAVKKRSKKDYESLGIEPEKIRMSRGIGLSYFERHYKYMYKNDHVLLNLNGKVSRMSIPKYFDRRLEKIDPRLHYKVKSARRRKAVVDAENKYGSSDLTFIEKCAQQQRIFLQRQSALKRPLGRMKVDINKIK